MTTPRPASPRRLWVLYLGGFMGPFGGGVVNTMLPELADGLGTTIEGAALSISWYLGPFAAFLLVSGTLATRWGSATVVRAAYLTYAVSSVAAVLVTTLPAFLVTRAVQGAANAFLTPVLIAMVVAVTPRERIGRALGTVAVFQAAGQSFAPLAGGLSAEVDWRIAFVASGVVAVLLMVLTPSGAQLEGDGRPASWRSMLNPLLASTATITAAAQFVAAFVVLSAALIASDRFGLTPTYRGLVVVAFGLSGMAVARAAGAWSDRVGMWTMGVVATGALGVFALVTQVTPYLWLLVLAVLLAGAGATGLRILSNSFALSSTPANPAGATSVAQSAQFAGGALAPLLLPLFDRSPAQAGLVLLAVLAVGIVVVSLPAEHRHRPGRDGTIGT